MDSALKYALASDQSSVYYMRYVAIANRAKAKAHDMMVFVFGALMLAFTLMGTDMTSVLLLVFAYLFVIGYAVYYRCKYDKEM